MTRDYAEVLREQLAADPELAGQVDDERLYADIAQQVYDARIEAGLTQDELANLINTRQSAIARLESTDYTGHSLTMLHRIAKALSKRLRVELTDDTCTNSFAAVWSPAVMYVDQDSDDRWMQIVSELSVNIQSR